MRYIEQCSVRETYPKLHLHPLRLVGVTHIGGGGVVVKRLGRLPPAGVVNQARIVLPTHKTQDAIDQASVTTTRHNRPVPAQVIKKNY